MSDVNKTLAALYLVTEKSVADDVVGVVTTRISELEAQTASMRSGLGAVNLDAVPAVLEDGRTVYELSQWAIDKVRAALASDAGAAMLARVRKLEEFYDEHVGDKLEAAELENERDRLSAALDVAERHLKHIADKTSIRDCCKFAAMNGYRRRHLKELAREALAQVEKFRGGE